MSSTSSKSPSWRWHCSRNSRTPARISSNVLSSLRFLPPLRKKWPSTSSSLRSIQHPLSSFYHIFYLSHSYLLGIFSLSFPRFFNLQTIRNWLRKLLFPSINPTFNALVHWETQIPTNLINAETNRIPFRAENFSLDLWEDTFRSWPSSTKGWRDWFLRIGNSNEVQWGEHKLDQCIRLSIADMERNESLLIAASYFWSDTLNAFVFGHGPASPTLADVLMLTRLEIATAMIATCSTASPNTKWKLAISTAGQGTFRSTGKQD